MSDYLKSKVRAQELQARKELEIKREIAAKKEKDVAAAKEAEARRKRLDEAAAEARRQELRAANAALTTAAPAPIPSARSVEYNPFAEDEYAPSAHAGPSTLRAKLAPGGGRLGGERVVSSTKNGSSSGKAKKEKERESSPPLLGRKERAARALAQQLKKQTKGEPFSIRSLVDSDDRGGSSSPAPRSLQPAILNRQSVVPKKMVAPGKKGAAAVNDLRKLAPGRDGWDRRSIDEIARDLKASRGKVEAPNLSRTKSSDGPPGLARTNGGQRPRSSSPARSANKTKPKPPPIPSSARAQSSSLKRPRRSSSSSSSASPPPRRTRLLDPNNIADISSEIQSLFRRPGAAPRYAASDFSSDDMEARMSDVEEEERRAARIAKREDEIAEREERERREKKEKLRRAGR